MRKDWHFTAIEIELNNKYFHAAGAVYFKMLDDAAFFAVNSLEREVFVLTASFTIYLMRPVSSGYMRSIGKVVGSAKSQFIAESIGCNSDGKGIAHGNGIFVRGELILAEAMGYQDKRGDSADVARGHSSD